MIMRMMCGLMERRLRCRRVGPSISISERVTSTAETACEMIVASATPATLILNPMTNTRFSPALITPAMVRKYSGRLVSPTARSTAAQKL